MVTQELQEYKPATFPLAELQPESTATQEAPAAMHLALKTQRLQHHQTKGPISTSVPLH